ncbi:MAG: phosphoribosylanthranilate isomerase [Rikenellaceae bacterium]|nr:phosphoribosylanthranilate isomerase [Rikenellaceae bacterium]
MRDRGNIAQLGAHAPDYIGLIFYPKSPRFIADMPPDALDGLPSGTKRVGVFVNAEAGYIRQQVSRYRLDLVQLHGDETPAFCRVLREMCPVIKAFGIRTEQDLTGVLSYEGSCDYFLFDAKTPQRGGAGVKFDHSVLAAYSGTTPYFLSGGIGPEDISTVNAVADSRCVAVDVNSRFEISAAYKDIGQLERFIQGIRTNKIGNDEQDR